MTLSSAISRLYDHNVGTTPLEEGERTRPRVPIPAPPPESFSGKRMFLRDTSPGRPPKTIGGGADGNTRGRVCSPMDRNLIAPCPDHHWHVTKILDPRRSTGEKELIELAGKSLILPKDPAFHPDRKRLECRCQRLTA